MAKIPKVRRWVSARGWTRLKAADPMGRGKGSVCFLSPLEKKAIGNSEKIKYEL